MDTRKQNKGFGTQFQQVTMNKTKKQSAGQQISGTKRPEHS
jgi:hypothetical protein